MSLHFLICKWNRGSRTLLSGGEGIPDKDRVPVPNEGGQILIHHDAIHEIFHVINRPMQRIRRKVVAQTQQKLSASHQPSGVSLGFLEGVRLSDEISFKDVGKT